MITCIETMSKEDYELVKKLVLKLSATPLMDIRVENSEFSSLLKLYIKQEIQYILKDGDSTAKANLLGNFLSISEQEVDIVADRLDNNDELTEYIHDFIVTEVRNVLLQRSESTI